MFELSLFGSFRRNGEKLQRRELFRTASSYYIPEGRFYSAPLVLKQKNRNNYFMPVVLGLVLAVCGVSTIKNVKSTGLTQVKTTVFAKNLDDISNILQQNSYVVFPNDDNANGIDPMTTASTNLIKNYRSLPVSDDKAGGKLGVSDPFPDESRINRKEKTSNFSDHEAISLPELGKSIIKRLAVKMLPQASDGRYVTTMVALKNNANKAKALSIVPPPKPRTLPIPTALAALATNQDVDVLALGYAPETAKLDSSPFDSIMSNQPTRQNMGRFIPPIGKDDHAWAATPLPADTFSAVQQKCLAEAIYFESRGESVKGQAAVAQVVLNRVRNPAYPANVCGVVYQNINWRNQCQFSFACDGIKHSVTEIPQWILAEQIAKAVSAGQIWLPEIGSATHYHATYVQPNWASSMVKMDKIGLHIFYRTIGGGWS